MTAPAGVFRGISIPEFTARTFPQLFEDQAARLSNKTALEYEGHSLTFAELNARVNKLARYLTSLGAKRETIIGICVDRSLDMAVGILGILKSGAAYLPLDPEYPQERLAMMLDDAKPALVLTNSSLAVNLPTKTRVVQLDDWSEISKHSDQNLDEAPQPNDLAYVIYTSGSTGRPKGVMITHGNLANYLRALDHELDITPEDIYLHTASIAFSSSRRQLMLPLSQGASVVIASSEQRKDPLALFTTIKERRVTVMDAVPSFWRNCANVLASLETEERQSLLDNKLRLMLSASEPLLSDIPRIWISEFGHNAHHVHMFGQTETAGIVCLYHLPNEISGDVEVIPIGHPIANSEIYILDEQQKPCAVGVSGELYIGGAGVGRGYLNQVELTEEKFIADLFSDRPGARLYRTGDWARYDADGQIRFVGRRDQQVKLRGFRVELGEVEAALANHPAIRETVVVACQENSLHAKPKPAEKKLIAYFVARETAPTVSELRNFLSSQLPEYAVPAAFVELAEMPLSANGKLDRLALPDPDNTRPDLSENYVAPRNEIEHALAQIWSDVLTIDLIGINDNFFELGGNSLQATQVCARARRKFKCSVPLRLIFERPTIALLAAGVVAAELDAHQPITSSRKSEYPGSAPLSFTQQQFWLLDQAHPNTAHYNVRTAIRIEGPIDLAKLQHAFDAFVTRHEILRTTFVEQDGSPVQVVRDSIRLPFAVSDLSDHAEVDREGEAEQILEAAANKPFDLASGPLLRANLVKLAQNAHILGITIHHIICDGWSLSLLLREVFALYKAPDEKLSCMPPPPIQFADFAIWQREHFESAEVQQQVDYWKQQLTPLPTALELPVDYRRPGVQTFNGAQESLHLSQSLSDSIRRFSRREGTTPFMTLLAAFQTLLFRYTGQTDIAVGSPVAGRTLVETENLIGACVNTVVFRGDLSGSPTFRDFLKRVREVALGAYANQEVPFEKLVEELRPERGTSRTPLFQVMFVVQNTPPLNLQIDGLKLSVLSLKRATAKFDLTLEVAEEPHGLRASLEYSTDLFAPASMQRLLEHFQNLLHAIVADPTKKVSELNLISDVERTKLLVDWNDTQADFSNDACIHELFEAQVARTPEAIAAEFDGQRLTYAELNRRANQLANYLVKRGVSAEVCVGICIERSLEILTSILAVLKAGGAYVPLDPTYPRERLAFIIDNAALSIILTQQRFIKDLPRTSSEFICVDADAPAVQQESAATPNVAVAPENLCYVIYTSGSTGNPKGVMIEHRSLVNFVEAVTVEYAIALGDRVLQFASLNFDLSAEEIYPALTRGATVVLRSEAMINSAREFLATCSDWQLTVLDLPTAYWHELLGALEQERLQVPPCVRLVIIGGEKALPESVAAWETLVSDSVRLINSYGPTETTVAVTTRDLGHDAPLSAKSVPIGRPLRNTILYVLDEGRQPVPIGVPGELYVGGACLARGYLNRTDLTTEKFVSNPFDKTRSDRLYRTGDIVRYQVDGNLEFLGRVDNQIKIRGFRIELEEIERVLRNHSAVSDAVVTVDEDPSGNKRLVAYFVANGSEEPSSLELRTFVKTKLPSYMLPATFEKLAAIPLLPSGKVDRRALPQPQAVLSSTDEDFVSPRTPVEHLLASAWREALKVERVSIYDNFFELGGHSLLAARVVSNVRKELSVEFGMADVLRSPTIAELATLIDERSNNQNGDSDLAALLQEVAALSDEEAEARLAEEFKREKSDSELLPA